MSLKNKIKTTIHCALMLFLFALCMPQLISGNVAFASTGAANFLPNCYIDESLNGPDTMNEVNISVGTFAAINSLLDGYYANFYSSYNTTYDDYDSLLSTLETYHDTRVVFTKGHRGIRIGQIPITLD